MIDYLASKPLSTVVGLVLLAIVVLTIVVCEAVGRPIKNPPTYRHTIFPWIGFRRWF